MTQPALSLGPQANTRAAALVPAKANAAVERRVPFAQAEGSEAAAHKATQAQTTAETNDDGFSFWDLIDVINPFQHIPVVNILYRELTGDTIRDEARIAGGALYGGVVGLASSVADVAIKAETGKDIAGNVLGVVGIETGGTTSPSGKTPTVTVEETPAVQPADAEEVTAATPAPEAAPAVTGGPSAFFRSLQQPRGTVNAANHRIEMQARAINAGPAGRPELDVRPSDARPANAQPASAQPASAQPASAQPVTSPAVPATAATDAAASASDAAPVQAGQAASQPAPLAPDFSRAGGLPPGFAAPIDISAQMNKALEKYAAMKRAETQAATNTGVGAGLSHQG